MDGIELLAKIRAMNPDLPVVLVTGRPSIETATKALEQGACRYLLKPVETAALTEVVSHAVQQHHLARARRIALDRLGGPTGISGAALVEAFERTLGSLYVAYQPIVSSSGRRIFGYEALLRSREKALPHPGAVLDAAERLGRTRDVGRVVRTLAPEPCTADGPLLFVNLHARDLLDDELYARGTPLADLASSVVLEITERAALHDVPDVQARVARLRKLGYRIALDDLGAGYAGLTSLAMLEPEIVKLDMSLVRGLHRETTKRTLIRTLIGMCGELGMQVVAEGVETPDERRELEAAGCDLMQGYLFAKPGDAFPGVRW